MTTAVARPVPQQRRSNAKVTAILDAARELLTSEEVESVTTSAIAARAGVAVGTVYRYFADVDEIFGVLVDEHATAAAQAVEAALDRSFDSVSAVFEATLDAHLDLYRRRPELTRLWFSAPLAERQRRAELATDRELARRVGQRLVEDGLIPRLTPTIERRLDAHWQSAGALLTNALRTTPMLDPDLVAELRALVAHVATRY